MTHPSQTKRIVVPPEMLEAAQKSFVGLVAATPSEAEKVIIAMLEAALLWQSKHAPGVSDKQLDKLHKEFRQNTDGSPYPVGIIDAIAFGAMWFRRMYDAPKSEVPGKSEDALVMYIMRHFDDVEHDQRTLRNRAEAAVADYQNHVKRNEGIKYLLLKEDIPEADFSRPTRGFFNAAVTEAFYRGKQSKEGK